jgi:hypothetical protein
MNVTLSAPVFAGILFAGIVLCLEAGRRLGLRRLTRHGASTGFGVVEGAIFALFGLLIAFTFSGAASRFDARRMLIADEANAIGTAYLRLDLLASDDQLPMRQMFRDYLDSRLEVYRRLPNFDAALAELKRSEELQRGIWTRAVAATRRPEAHANAAMLLLTALNEMFDITTTRTMAARTHPPTVIYYFLVLLAFGCALLAGHAMAGVKNWSWVHAFGFALFMTLAVYVILDIEFPRAGFVRLTAFDEVLVELRDSMK